MVDLDYIKELFDKYETARKQLNQKMLIRALICAVVVLVFGFRISRAAMPENIGMSMMAYCSILGFFPVVFLWRSWARRMGALDTVLNDVLLQETMKHTFGASSQGKTKNPILKPFYGAESKVIWNRFFQYEECERPFRIYETRITNGDTGEDEVVHFSGMAIAVPAKDDAPEARAECSKMLNLGDKRHPEAMPVEWMKELHELSGRTVKACVEQFDDTRWLTVGFKGMTLGVRPRNRKNLTEWARNVADHVEMLNAIYQCILRNPCVK